MPFWLKSPDLGFVCVEKTLDPLFAVMAAIYPSSSPMACDTVASFSVLEEASSVGDDYLLLDTPRHFRHALLTRRRPNHLLRVWSARM